MKLFLRRTLVRLQHNWTILRKGAVFIAQV